ncbi:hypothetical protein BAU15_02630 [Enterococcus sp. JM4C]|uniref:alpha/beta fold hydrolase n=1 Tax=Candidatus Enterococcus huntleyi TaxID=1857217 RepID=UPI00137A2233|nr:alpha/beta fold hydrolase [Enterococcus sp. JM4C]KAF1299558.1 hypothetical protein BAU15_02630 [Enterococcus sp. JM4C]
MKKRALAVIIFGLILLSACSTGASKTTDKAANQKPTTSTVSDKENKTATPSLFIHGYSGTKGSFGGMLKRLESSGDGIKELTLTVSSSGEVSAEGELSGEKNNPMVQILFEDNKNNEWNQAEWLRGSLEYLKEEYQVSQVNLVGHSMGGVSSLRYLGAYGNESDLPTVDKFIAIGAPFNDFDETPSLAVLDEELANGPTNKSARYQEYQQTIGNVSTQIAVLLIGGQLSETDLSDGTVPLGSALAVNALLAQNGNPVETKIFEGQNAQHSQLHENTAVDQAVSEFLWSEE